MTWHRILSASSARAARSTQRSNVFSPAMSSGSTRKSTSSVTRPNGSWRCRGNRVPVQLALPSQRDDRVADVRRLDVSPVQVRGIAPNGEVELRCEPFPQRGEGRIESSDGLALRPQRPRTSDDPDNGVSERRHDAIERIRPVGQPDSTTRQRLHDARQHMGGGQCSRSSTARVSPTFPSVSTAPVLRSHARSSASSMP